MPANKSDIPLDKGRRLRCN